MATFTAIRNKKQTAGTLYAVLSYVMQDRKTMLDDKRLVMGQKFSSDQSWQQALW